MEDISLYVMLFLIIAGFLAAFIDSVVGGGGMISTPALLASGLPPSTALGTNKLASTMGSFTSMISFMRNGQINKRLVWMLFPLSFGGSVFGVFIVQLLPPDVLEPIILVLLIIVTIYTILKRDWGMASTFKGISVSLLMFAGTAAFVIGFYDGFLGAGTGSFLLFAFLMMGFNFVEAAGNAKVLNFGSNIAALITFISFDSVHFIYGITMGLAMVAGAYMGVNFAIKKGAAYVKLLFVIVTVLLIAVNIWEYMTAS